MSIRRRRIASAVLSIGVLLFATGTSADVPGLATEAPTVEALSEKLRTLIPELLEANGLLSSGQPDAIAFELTSHRQEKVRSAS